MKRAWLAVVALALSGCSWISASPNDYAAYRRTRLSKTFEQRIAAASRYLREHPDGAYAADVRAYMSRAEPVFYESRQGSLEGLEAYLRALPEGPRSQEVRTRIQLIREQAARPDSLLLAARSTEERLARAAKARERARSELAFWLELLADPEVYRAPVSQGPAELVTAFSLALPAPRCKPQVDGGSRCDKDVEIDYLVPTSKGLEERALLFTVTLEEDATGRPLAARVEGEEMFSRLEETFAKRPIDSEGIRDRISAIERGIEAIRGGFDSKVSQDLACNKPVVAPEVLQLECGGMRVTARAALELGGFDSVRFEPVR